jgi:uncharacterized caspase-like protein/WD40 repeat protein
MKQIFLLSLLFAGITLQAQKPELVLPALHSSEIVDVCFSSDNRFMATCASDAKEIKLWEQKTGRLIRTVQTSLPIGQIALSNNGSRLVCASSKYSEEPNTEVQLWDMVSGHKLRTLKALGNLTPIAHVAISADGNKAIAIIDHEITLWDLRTGSEEWRIEGSGKGHFSSDGNHFLLEESSSLSWVDCKNGKKTEITKEPHLVCAAQDNKVVIITRSKRLKHWDAHNNTFSTDISFDWGLDYQDERPYNNICFSADGTRLGVYNDDYVDGSSYISQFRVFDTNTGQLLTKQGELELDGRIFIAPDFNYLFWLPMPHLWSQALFSPMIAIDASTGKQSHEFGLDQLVSTANANANANTGLLEFRVFNEGTMILINRSELSEHSTLFLPVEGKIICSDDPNKFAGYSIDQKITEDKRWRLECKDGLSYQLIDSATGKVLATLLLADDTRHEFGTIWAVTTPSGLFDASPEMMENLHYVVGMEVIELSQLKERYYEPGLLLKLLGISTGELRNVEAFNDVPLYPEISATIENNQLKINLLKRNGGLGKLSFFINNKEVYEDINAERKASLSIDLNALSKYYRTDTLNTLSLLAYNNEGWLKSQAFQVPYAYSASKGSSQGGSTPMLGNAKPRLFAIIVGTADYSGEKLDLKYADQDATSMASALNAAGRELFGSDVQLKLLSTKSNISAELAGSVPSEISAKSNIKAAFDAFAQQAQPTDVLVLYFSGHGITYGEAEKAQFYYLTKDIGTDDLSDPEVRNKFTISSNELTDWIKNIAAQKQVLILDACNSGKIVETLSAIGQKDLNPSQVRALDRMKDRTGMFILTGSAANMVSYEASQYGQGLLTYSLLQGMSGLALADEKRVDVMTLFQYSRDKVPELARSINGVQIPTLAFPLGGGSFDIGIVNDKVKIPLSQAKPVFIRNNFQDDDAFEDVLGLTDALEQYFRQQISKGAQSKLIYVDVKEYENAYSMKGRYSIKDSDVEVRFKLFKGKTAQGEEIKVTGKKEDVPGLVKAILKVVMPMAK